MNIRYGEDILHTCQTGNLRIAQLSHQTEPAEAQSRAGLTVAWGVSEAIQRMDTVPDIIYDQGMVGQEAMLWVLGQDAVEVVRKVLLIRHHLLGH